MYKGGRQGYDIEEEHEFQDLKSDLTSSDHSNNVSPDNKYMSPSLVYEDRKKIAQLVKSFSIDNIVNMSINDELKGSSVFTRFNFYLIQTTFWCSPLDLS